MSLPDKYIEYDVGTRWNSTYRMLDDGLKARAQIDRLLALQTQIPPFTVDEWLCLSQIHQVLAKFNGLTLFLSEKRPQFSLAVPLYHELHDLLYEGSESQGSFTGLCNDIAFTMKECLTKYKKYYTFMDDSDMFYTSLTLDPRVKRDLSLGEMEDKEAGDLILKALHNNLHQRYPSIGSELPRYGISQQSTREIRCSSVGSQMLQRLLSIVNYQSIYWVAIR